MRQRILYVILVFLLISCEKEETISPNDLLQGKWKIILIGNGDNLIPYEMPVIFEYYNDSLYREFDTIMNQFTFYGRYYIDQNLLIHYYIYPDDTLIFKYKYEFFDKNRKFKTIHQNLISTFNTDVFERIQ